MELFVNKLKEPINIDVNPVFGWTLDAEDFYQKAYQVKVYSGDETIWDSGKTLSDNSVCVEYEGNKLKSNSEYRVEVTVWDTKGNEYKGETRFESALLSQSDWHGNWIGMGDKYISSWAFQLRKEVELEDKKIRRAKAFVVGLGYYELRLNGEKVGDHMLDTAQTEYDETVFYATYDITAKLKKNNCFGIIVGDGWYHQSQLMNGAGIYGKPCAIMQVNIEYEDGTTSEVVTDWTWKVDYSPISRNNVYTGETYDARLEQEGWDEPGFDDSKWFEVVEDTRPKGKLISQLMPPIRVVKEIKPVSITHPQRGVTVFDLGENFAGLVRLKTIGFPGNEIVMRFAESLDETGMIDVTSSGVFHIRGVQTIRYIVGKQGEFTYTPKFTYHGFRYVELTGDFASQTVETITGLKMNTDLRQTGHFECDMPILNTLHQLLYNAFTSNAYGIPTDCPAREKCGWTGDANVIADTSMIIWDSFHFWDKYMMDTRDSKKVYGIWQNVMPGKRGCLDTVPAWGCAMINIPWYTYLTYGDKGILERNIEQMIAYHKYIHENTTDLIHNDHKYPLADWAAPYGYNSKEHFKQTSTAFFYMATVIIAETLKVLEKKEDVVEYEKLAERIKKKFIETFYDFENHTYGTQTLNSFCIELGLYDEGEDVKMCKWIVDDIKKHDGHLTCGHLGLRYIFNVLTKYGYNEVIKEFFEKDDYPSFGEQIKHGATTLYENWGVSNNQSYNHHFKGAFGYWLYNDVLGIKNTGIAYKTFDVKPMTIDIIKKAKGSIDTVYGRIEVDYSVGEYFKVKIPANTTATVYVPNKDLTYVKHVLSSGTYSF